MRRDKVGFGRQSREQATTTRNEHARVTTIPREDGFDVVVGSVHGLKTEGGESTVTLHFRNDHGPRIGERVMIGRSLVKVADRRYDQSGAIHVLDEDTKAWHKWPS